MGAACNGQGAQLVLGAGHGLQSMSHPVGATDWLGVLAAGLDTLVLGKCCCSAAWWLGQASAERELWHQYVDISVTKANLLPRLLCVWPCHTYQVAEVLQLLHSCFNGLA